jgi:hypothetical protein
VTAGRILALVFGGLAALVAIGLIVSGGLLRWFNAAKTDDEGGTTRLTCEGSGAHPMPSSQRAST